MERLTIEHCGDYVPKELCSIDRLGGADDCDLCCDYCKATVEGYEDCSECAINQCFNKLGEYEDLEENGRLLRLPCKVGDTVYSVSFRKKCHWQKENGGYLINSNIECIACEDSCGLKEEWFIEEIEATLPIIANLIEQPKDFLVFLTRSEAESALQKMNETKE